MTREICPHWLRQGSGPPLWQGEWCHSDMHRPLRVCACHYSWIGVRLNGEEWKGHREENQQCLRPWEPMRLGIEWPTMYTEDARMTAVFRMMAIPMYSMNEWQRWEKVEGITYWNYLQRSWDLYCSENNNGKAALGQEENVDPISQFRRRKSLPWCSSWMRSLEGWAKFQGRPKWDLWVKNYKE